MKGSLDSFIVFTTLGSFNFEETGYMGNGAANRGNRDTDIQT